MPVEFLLVWESSMSFPGLWPTRVWFTCAIKIVKEIKKKAAVYRHGGWNAGGWRVPETLILEGRGGGQGFDGGEIEAHGGDLLFRQLIGICAEEQV